MRDSADLSTLPHTGCLPIDWRRPFEQSFGRSFGHVRVELGPETDRLLGAEGALGQAVDASTIRLSRQLAAFPGRLRQLVVGHELAHTVQLARGGHDAEPALERAAWAAAHAAMNGETHQIQGAGRGPLCAKGLIDPAWPGSAALGYYRMFPFERYNAQTSSRVDQPEIVEPLCLVTLLDTILQRKKQGGSSGWSSLLIMTHGNEQGLVMKLFEDSSVVANTQTLKRLMTEDPVELAEATGFDSDRFVSLMEKVEKIRALKLGSLEFRGCMIGSNRESLRTLRDFFGAHSASAPDVKSTFGPCKPNVMKYDKKAWKNYKNKYSGMVIHETPSGEHFAIRAHPKKQLIVLSESSSATKWWIENYIGGADGASTKQFYVHFLSTSPKVTFPREDGYTKHIKRV